MFGWMISKKVVFRVTVPYHGEGTKSVNLRKGIYYEVMASKSCRARDQWSDYLGLRSVHSEVTPMLNILCLRSIYTDVVKRLSPVSCKTYLDNLGIVQFGI